MIDQFPNFLVHRIGVPTLSKYVVKGSTPIPFFGNFLSSRVYTIGINPSHKEFLATNGKLLDAHEKRLSDFQTLRINPIEGISPIEMSHSQEVLDSCLSYFRKNPYQWFNYLEKVVNSALRSSYFNDTACHLDLVQWATDPVWSNILKQDAIDARYLLESDLPFLIEQINWLQKNNKNLRCFFLSGRTVVERLKDVFQLQFAGKTQAPEKDIQYSLYKGQIDGIAAYGTSMNVSDSHTSDTHREWLAEWLGNEHLEEGR